MTRCLLSMQLSHRNPGMIVKASGVAAELYILEQNISLLNKQFKAVGEKKVGIR